MSVSQESYLGSGDKQKLIDYIAHGVSEPEQWRVGTEYEKLALTASGERLGYEDSGQRPGIRRLLEALGEQGGWTALEEAGMLIGLKREGASITLEPGGQFELSGAPLATIHETREELDQHLEDLRWLTGQFGVRWGWAGMDPQQGLEAIPWMPKGRYAVMRAYLPTRGKLALWMMKKTCTVQANLDFSTQLDMGKKLRVGMGLGSIVTAMFANSPLNEGKVSRYKSYRAHIWTDTDPDRTGLLPWALAETPATYEQWVDHALDVPMFFFVREGSYVPCAGLPFRRFMTQGHEGHQATLADWELHLSTLFPEVRLKTYLEMRSADCVAPELICALPALWKGLLYDGAALDAAWDLVRRWSFDEREMHRADAARLALAAPVPGRTYLTSELAKELLAIARSGLANIAAERGHDDEGVHLMALERLTLSGRCPADETLAWFKRTPASQRVFSTHYG